MIKRRVRLKISDTSHEVIRLFERNLRALCPACGRETEMVTDDEAVRILNGNSSLLRFLLNAGTIHSLQTVNGNLWVCKESLFCR
jgi:hypothetical protein